MPSRLLVEDLFISNGISFSVLAVVVVREGWRAGAGGNNQPEIQIS